MSNKKQPPADQRQQLNKDIEDFLRHGGKFEQVDAGITGEKHPWLKGRKNSRPCTVVKLPNHIAPGLTI